MLQRALTLLWTVVGIAFVCLVLTLCLHVANMNPVSPETWRASVQQFCVHADAPQHTLWPRLSGHLQSSTILVQLRDTRTLGDVAWRLVLHGWQAVDVVWTWASKWAYCAMMGSS